MEITITKFRQEIFELVNEAMSGREIWVTHKGRRFRIVPDEKPSSRLSRLTPLDVVNPTPVDPAQLTLQQEMERAWEADWATL